MVGALVGASGFLLLATFASMPVSTTHAIVGGIVGMTMAGTNASCVDWSYDGVGGIIVSWVTSPAIAGAIGAAAFLATEFGLLRSANPFHRTRVFIPILYAAVTFVMVCVEINQ
jgi:sodium-dependent phosphate transporter